MSITGNTTYVKSLNGIITFDDGAGTVIEDGVITTDSFSTINFDATTVNSDTVNSDTTNTDNIQNILDTNIYVYTNLPAERELFVGDLCSTIIGGGSLTVTPTTVKTDNLSGIAAVDPISLYTATTGNITLGGTGRINLGASRLYTTGNNLLHTTASTAVNLLNTTTGDITLGSTGKINLGNTINITGNTIASSAISDTVNLLNTITTGTVNLLNGIRTGGALNIASNTSDLLNTAPVNIGGTNTSATIGDLSRIKLNLNGDAIWSNTNTLTSFRSAGINLATTPATANGVINIGAEAGTTSAVNIGVAGNGKTVTIASDTTTFTSTQVRVNNQLWFPNIATAIDISCATSAIGIDLFKPFRTGDVNICTSHRTGTIYLGNSTGTTAGILGNVVMGNALNNLTTAGNGTVSIKKLQIGDSPAIRQVRYGQSGAGLGSGSVTFSPAFPAGQTPYVVGTIVASDTSAIIGLHLHTISNTGFSFAKPFIFVSGASGGLASAQPFNWTAWTN